MWVCERYGNYVTPAMYIPARTAVFSFFIFIFFILILLQSLVGYPVSRTSSIIIAL